MDDERRDAGEGSGDSAADLVPLIYDKLRALARQYMQGERPGGVLQPTALVHEAYLRLARINRMDWQGKTHFYAMAATQMRRILVERGRAAGTQKRGERPRQVTFEEHIAPAGNIPVNLLALDEALDTLSSLNERQARVAELRLFSGMLVTEVAHVLGVSERTVKQDWRVARAWLSAELSPTGSDETRRVS